jgi:hypothetical protein
MIEMKNGLLNDKHKDQYWNDGYLFPIQAVSNVRFPPFLTNSASGP